jgi:hypothetical protein
MATATATRKSAKTTARKEPKHTPALQRVIPYQEKVRLMVIEVLREESGRELAASARFNGQEFDWNTMPSFVRTMPKPYSGIC